MRKLVAFLDPNGAPRAWGVAPTEATAEAEARRQLEAYCVKKAALGDADLADPTKFTKYTADCE